MIYPSPDDYDESRAIWRRREHQAIEEAKRERDHWESEATYARTRATELYGEVEALREELAQVRIENQKLRRLLAAVVGPKLAAALMEEEEEG